MDCLAKAYVKVAERRGQAMTEYALILAAVAVVAMVTYQQLGTQISGLVSNVIADL